MAELSNVLTDSLTGALDKLAVACRILEMEGHGSRTQGHMALRDPDGRGIWLKRSGLAFSEVHDHRDFVLIDFEGNQLYGEGKRHNEWPIHTEIMKRREDVHVTAHSHPFYGRVFSASTEPLRAVSLARAYFQRPPPRFELTSELICSEDVAARMVDVLADNHAIFLRNHGVVFCGDTIERATIMGVRLEESCQEQLTIAASGLGWSYPDDEEDARRYRGLGSGRSIIDTFAFHQRRLEALEAQGHPSFPARRLDVGL
ncbi:MAG: class II aldolase/adducin family protein [Alphaproteobacteria bacterium]|nr:class II aldolase/adducin family protein [Alphaproteobacteria bacterium]